MLLVEAVLATENRGKGFRLVHYAVRSNHLHLVCEADERLALSRGIQRLGSRVARGINRLLGRSGKLFADRFHARVFRTPREARRVLAYVLLNAHKDLARRGARLVGLDPFSSGVYFDGWAHLGPRAPPRLDTDDGGAPVTKPASWLLRVGWRRAGLIRTDERAPATAQPRKTSDSAASR